MRYGHESGGLTGLTLKPSVVARWALSLHIYSQLRGDLVAMKEGQDNTIGTTHKEETQGRLASDSSDRQKIQNALQSYIDTPCNRHSPTWPPKHCHRPSYDRQGQC